MRIEEVRGRPVMSIVSVATLGAVRDFLLDDSYLQIAGIVIGGGGLFGGHKHAVAYSAIRSIGPYAVMVDGQGTVQDVDGSGPFSKARAMKSLRQQVMSERGVKLGRVAAREFDPQTGAVTSISFPTRGDAMAAVRDICDVSRADIVNVTGKIVTVRQSVARETPEWCPSHAAVTSQNG